MLYKCYSRFALKIDYNLAYLVGVFKKRGLVVNIKIRKMKKKKLEEKKTKEEENSNIPPRDYACGYHSGIDVTDEVFEKLYQGQLKESQEKSPKK